MSIWGEWLEILLKRWQQPAAEGRGVKRLTWIVVTILPMIAAIFVFGLLNAITLSAGWLALTKKEFRRRYGR